MKTELSLYKYQSVLAAITYTLAFVSCANATTQTTDYQESNGLDTLTVETQFSKGNFSIKIMQQLPKWSAERYYMLNDNRIVEEDKVQYIGGYDPERGEVFFIDGKEIVFSSSQIKIQHINGLNTKTMYSDEYQIQIVWEDDMTTGDYSEGSITLYFQKIEKFHGPLVIMEWY